MLPVDEVIRFSVDYVNRKKERTARRKRIIRQAYREVFNREMTGSCSTCYIEAVLEIVKSFKKLTMATANYELKRGVLLEAFGHPEKACTNDNLTDELAEWHLRTNPAKAIYFAKMPGNLVTNVIPLPPQPAPPPQRPGERIIVAPDKIIIPEEKPVDIAAAIIAGATEAPKEVPKEDKSVVKEKPKRKTKAKK